MSNPRDRDLASQPSSATAPAQLPSLAALRNVTDNDLRRFLEAVKEILEVREGRRGNKYERVVTWRDLADLGVVSGDFLGARFSMQRRPGGGSVMIQNENGGYTSVSFEEFAQRIRDTSLYRNLIKRLNDPTRFDDLPGEIRDILLNDIVNEAKLRGADVRRIETKLQQVDKSIASVRDEITAAAGDAAAGVRSIAYAYAEPGRAAAGRITQISSRLDNIGDNTGVTIEEALFTNASLTGGLFGQYTLKIDANGKVAGFGLSNSTSLAGVGTSAFIILADKFAVVGSSDTVSDPANPPVNRIPFGIDTVNNTIYLNGNVRINAGGTKLNDLVADTGVTLSSTADFFKVDSTGNPVNTSITLTATLFGGLTGTVTWTAGSGWTGTPPTGTNTWTINAADQTADAVTYTASKTDGSTTYTDTFTIVRLKDGSDALTAILTNESHGIPTAADGSAGVFTNANGTFKVYRGATQLTSGVTYALKAGGNPSGVTQSINSATGFYNVSDAGTWANSSMSASVTYQATVGSTVLEKVFSLTKSPQGNPGTASNISVLPSSLVFRVAKDGTVSPSFITLGTVLQGISGTITWTVPDNTSHALHNTTGGTKTIYPLTADPSPNMGSANIIKIQATCAGFTDTVSIVKVFEGSDAVTAVLSNESHNVPTDASGGSPNFTGASTTMSVFVGALDTSVLWTYTTAATNVTISGTNTRTVTITALSADGGYVDITASRAGFSSITKRFTVTRSKQGPQGNTGSTGSTGPAGARGSRMLYRTSSSYTSGYNNGSGAGLPSYQSQATTEINAVVTPSGPIQGDQVTFSNGTNYTITLTYNGSSWALPGVVIDGSLLVTGSVSTTALIVGTLTGFTIQTAASGARLAMNDSGNANQMVGYDSSSVERFRLNGTTGAITSASSSSLFTATSSGGYAFLGTATGSTFAAKFVNSGTGFALELDANSTKAPLRMIPQASLPSDRTLGAMCVLTDTNLYFANGTHWYRVGGLVQVT